ncbi:MAG: hypothetical protein JXB62_10985 [Pirellulales bacterium]|nr:hypothetical protein [Pirellulales bacterium]
MMRLMSVLTALALVGVLSLPATAAYHVSFDFETSWSGDYAPGWQNTDYRHGDPPIGRMMEQVSGGYLGGSAVKVYADSVPQSWMWWAAVNPIDVDSLAMVKQYNPWVKAMWYDEGADLDQVGQLYAVPSWVNPYISGSEDWTDVQYGGRIPGSTGPRDDYFYVAAGENSPGWVDTGIARTDGWHELKMQLLESDGRIHFYLDGVEVGASYRDDYIDLTGIGLMTQFAAPLSSWGDDKPYSMWDNFEYGSDVPEPASLIVWGLLGVLAVATGWRCRKGRAA